MTSCLMTPYRCHCPYLTRLGLPVHLHDRLCFGGTSDVFEAFSDRGPPLSLNLTAFPAHLGHISGKKRPRCQQYQGSRSTFLTAQPTYNRTSGTKFPPTVLQIRKKTLPLHPLLSIVMSRIPRDKQKNITDRFGSSAG